MAQYRDEAITTKEEQTTIWDTVTKDIDIDKWLFIAKTLVSGEIPYKFIDFWLINSLAITGQEIVVGTWYRNQRPYVGILSIEAI